MLINRIFCSFVVVILLSACGQTQRPVQTTSKPVNKQAAQISALSGDDYYSLAKDSSSTQQIEYLLRASEAWASENRCEESLKTLSVLLPELEFQPLKKEALLVYIQCLNKIEQWELSLSYVQEYQREFGEDLSILILALKAQQALGLNQQALSTLSALLSLSEVEQKQEITDQIWSQFQSLEDSASERWANDQFTQWHALLQQCQSRNSQELPTYLQSWTERNPNYLLPTELESILALETHSPTNIGILLPLSGRMSSQGNAIKDGIVAAYYSLTDHNQSTSKPQIRFYDIQLLTDEKIQALTLNHDQIIGPLLKDNIQRVQSLIADQTRQLYLNRMPLSEQTPGAFYFALSPEDEAQQLAEQLHSKNLHNPLIIYSSNAVFKRMAESFDIHWQGLTGTAPKMVMASFDNSKAMKKAIDTQLDVEQSRNRIKTVEALSKLEVHSYTRNRRDINAVVMFADSEQSGLLNPMIAASISPFAEEIPVFASSRSYSQLMDSSDFRDLDKLTFVDIPWITGSDSELKTLSKELWPNRVDGHARLFALGYDALEILPYLPQMHQASCRRYNGLTGELRVENNRVIRQLPVLRIEQQRVLHAKLD